MYIVVRENTVYNTSVAETASASLERGSEHIMFTIRYVAENDMPFWYTLDTHLSKDEFALKIRDKRGYVIGDGDTPIGILRYNLFLDCIPFLTLIHILEGYHGKGFGRQTVIHWENEMRELGHTMVMTSTQVDEQAQHFYRKLGYLDRGAIFFDNTPFTQAQEMVMLKCV